METSVAIIDDDEGLVSALVRELKVRKYNVKTASSGEAALKMLGKQGVDVLLTDLRMGETDGMDLLSAVRVMWPDTRSILMSAFATVQDYKRAMELGAVDVLTKPFSPDDLAQAIDKAKDCEQGFHGTMHGISVTDVLQVLHFGKRSATVNVGSTGKIYLKDGEIVHAQQDNTEGTEALRIMLSAASGSVNMGPAEACSQTIHGSFDGILLDTLRKIDEGRIGMRSSGEISEAALDEAFGEVPDTKQAVIAAEDPTIDATPRGPDPSNRAAQPIVDWTQHRPAEDVDEDDPAPRKRGVLLFASLALLALFLAGTVGFLIYKRGAASRSEQPEKAVAKSEVGDRKISVDQGAQPANVADSRQVVINSTPKGMELVNADTGQRIGVTPLSLKVAREELPLNVKALYDGHESQRFLITVDFDREEQEPSHLDLQSWYARLRESKAVTTAAAAAQATKNTALEKIRRASAAREATSSRRARRRLRRKAIRSRAAAAKKGADRTAPVEVSPSDEKPEAPPRNRKRARPTFNTLGDDDPTFGTLDY